MDKRKKSGDRINGSLDPFKNDQFKCLLSEITQSQSAIPEVSLSMLRDDFKIMVALRMQHGLEQINAYKKVSEDSRRIIAEYLSAHGHNMDIGFVDCCLRYYSREKSHTLSLNVDCASCHSRDKGKALAHARADCLKLKKVYVKKIQKSLKKVSVKPNSDLQ